MDNGQVIDTAYGKVFLRNQRKQRRKFLLGEQMQDFARNTTLHGLRYITERGVTVIEKIFWLTLFLLSVVICSYQISNVWMKWQKSPVIVSIDERLVPVSEVPFPSVTICPQWKIATEDFDYAHEKAKVLEVLEKFRACKSEEARKKVEDLTLICDNFVVEAGDAALLNRNYSDVEIVKNIEEATNYTNNNMRNEWHCEWRQNTTKCKNMFKKVLTEEGVCFNFNGLPFEDIYRTDQIQQNYSYIESQGVLVKKAGDHKNTFNYPYGKLGRRNRAEPFLSVLFHNNKSAIDKACNGLYSGYKIYVHHPSDMPQSSVYYYAMPQDQTSAFALKYSVMTTSDSLKEYPIEVRQCYFTGERELRYFKIYTENNCRLECLSNHTYHKCGCVGFYMPHYTSDRICTIQSFECMYNVLETIAELDVASTSLRPGSCNCLPACNTIEYDAEVLKSEFHFKHYLTEIMPDNPYVTTIKNDAYSRLEMFFKSPRYVAMRRSELFGRTDFIANSGGLLGLFLGFSFLSLVEIIYFITLRIWCTFKRDSEEDKAKEIQSNEKNP